MKTIEERRMVNNNQDTCMDCATHIHDNGDFYKRCDAHEFGSWLNFNPTNGFWTKSMMQKGREIELLTEIKPTPTKFVKVEESIFDLKEEFERGELYRVYAHHGDDPMYGAIDSEFSLIQAADRSNIYRKVEIDWRESVISIVPHNYGVSAWGEVDLRIDGSYSKEQALILANAIIESLTDKPE